MESSFVFVQHYAVFNEQGSSASHVTAAKVMDIISRLPGSAGQAVDAVSACTQVVMEDAPKFLKIPKSECPDVWIRLPRHKGPKSWSSMEDPVVPLERNLYSHLVAGLLWERQFEKILLKYGWEKVSNWECFIVHREKGLFLSVYVDDIKLAGKTGKKQNIHPMWNVLKKRSWFWRTDIIPWPRLFGMYSTRLSNKHEFCRQLQKYVRIHDFCWSDRKIAWNKSNWETWSRNDIFMVFWHGRSCKEVRAKILRTGKQNKAAIIQGRNARHGWSSIWRKRNESVGELSTGLLTNCFEISVFGSYWRTRHDMFREQTCTCDHKIEQSMRQTSSALDLLLSIHEWIQTVLSCGKHCTTMQIRTVSRLWLCRRSWRLEIDWRWNTVRILKFHFFPISWMCQKQTMCLTQFNRVWKLFLGMQVYAWTAFSRLISEIWLLM